MAKSKKSKSGDRKTSCRREKSKPLKRLKSKAHQLLTKAAVTMMPSADIVKSNSSNSNKSGGKYQAGRSGVIYCRRSIGSKKRERRIKPSRAPKCKDVSACATKIKRMANKMAKQKTPHKKSLSYTAKVALAAARAIENYFQAPRRRRCSRRTTRGDKTDIAIGETDGDNKAIDNAIGYLISSSVNNNAINRYGARLTPGEAHADLAKALRNTKNPSLAKVCLHPRSRPRRRSARLRARRATMTSKRCVATQVQPRNPFVPCASLVSCIPGYSCCKLPTTNMTCQGGSWDSLSKGYCCPICYPDYSKKTSTSPSPQQQPPPTETPPPLSKINTSSSDLESNRSDENSSSFPGSDKMTPPPPPPSPPPPTPPPPSPPPPLPPRRVEKPSREESSQRTGRLPRLTRYTGPAGNRRKAKRLRSPPPTPPPPSPPPPLPPRRVEKPSKEESSQRTGRLPRLTRYTGPAGNRRKAKRLRSPDKRGDAGRGKVARKHIRTASLRSLRPAKAAKSRFYNTCEYVGDTRRPGDGGERTSCGIAVKPPLLPYIGKCRMITADNNIDDDCDSTSSNSSACCRHHCGVCHDEPCSCCSLS
ncbi:hypothetical protein LSAT2_031123 [Lamellibrachia satsuma]|nr:hypothetical protein LSAT2_031123 [Lamellibrachia satsuma]